MNKCGRLLWVRRTRGMGKYEKCVSREAPREETSNLAGTYLLETSAGERLGEVLAVDERFDLHTGLVLGGENALDSLHL